MPRDRYGFADTNTAGHESVTFTAVDVAGNSVTQTCSFTVNGATQYTYVWKAVSAWKNSCHRFQILLNDGTLHTADFKFQ